MRLPVAVKVGAFALVVMGSYTYYANSIPQIQSKPPAELSLEGGNVTPAQLVKAGEEIFKTKGTCEICHRIGQKGTRAPDLAGRLPPGDVPGMSAKIHHRILLQPGAFLVEAPELMPQVDKPPICSPSGSGPRRVPRALAATDLTLNDIPKTAGAAAAGGAPAEIKIPGDPKAGEVVFSTKAACIACHKAGKIGASPVGPDLSQIAKIQTPDYIMKKILDPAGSGTVAGFPKGVMPPMFGQSLTAKEYMDLVAFLLTLK
jgi:mono/diheme cytochrome c family protein